MPAVDPLFDALLEHGGSDLHISVDLPPMLRVCGRLVPAHDRLLGHDEVRRMLLELLDDNRQRTFLERHDFGFAHDYGDKARFRAKYLLKTTGPGAVFRRIPREVPSVEALGLPTAAVELVERPTGLMLVTGPIGSGKSTTLASLVAQINHTRAGHILTIEEPVEFVHHPIRCQVTHRQVGEDTPTMAHALRNAGREDADVVVVGELLDAQSTRLALQLANCGVLVLATMVHPPSTLAVIERIINTSPGAQRPQIRRMIAGALIGVVAQQLVCRVGGDSRVAAYEVLTITPAVADAIRRAEVALPEGLRQLDALGEMVTMDAALRRLVEQGEVTAADGLQCAVDQQAFARLPAIRDQLSATQVG